MIYLLLGRLSYKVSINEVSDGQVQKFTNGSKEISNSFNSYTYKSSYYKNALRTKSVRKEDYIFFDNLHKKFFTIETFDGIYVLDGIMDALKNDKPTQSQFSNLKSHQKKHGIIMPKAV